MTSSDNLSSSLTHMTMDPQKMSDTYPDTKTMDITWISNRLVVVSQMWKHRSEKKSHRNNVYQVYDFLKGRYGDDFLVWNLSLQEQTTLDQVFGNRVIHLLNAMRPWPFPLECLIQYCQSIVAWLKLSSEHVSVLHCSNGLEKCGLVVACLLRYIGSMPSSFEGLDYFLSIRKHIVKDNLTKPIIKRYLRYYNDLYLLNGQYPSALIARKLRQVIISPVPNFDGKGDCVPGIEIYENSALVYTSLLCKEPLFSKYSASTSEEELKLTGDFDFMDLVTDTPMNFTGTVKDPSYVIFQFKNPLLLKGNIFVRVFHYTRSADALITMFTYYFHTGWTVPGIHRCRLRDLEIPLKDAEPIKAGDYSHSRFSKDFSVDFVLTEDSEHVSPKTVCIKGNYYNELCQLQEFLPIQLAEHVIMSIEQQCSCPRALCIYALYKFDGDIHAAHVFLINFRKHSDYYELMADCSSVDRSFLKLADEPTTMSSTINNITYEEPEENPKDLDKTRNKSYERPDPSTLKIIILKHEYESPEFSPRLGFKETHSVSLSDAIHTPSPCTNKGQEPPVLPCLLPTEKSNGSPPLAPPPPPIRTGTYLSVAQAATPIRARGTLHWQEVSALTLSPDSFWLNLPEHTINIPKDKFEKLFCELPTSKAHNSSCASVSPINFGHRSSPESLIVSLLGIRRSNNISIGLANFSKRFTESSLFEAITNASELLTHDDLSNLKIILPTPEERILFMFSKVKVSDGEKPSVLSSSSVTLSPEDFMVIMSSEPNIHWMVNVMLFQRTLAQDFSIIIDRVQLLSDLLVLLRTSSIIQMILAVVLCLGNLNNYVYSRNDVVRTSGHKCAKGFRIEALLRLRDIKGVDGKTTILEFLLSILQKHSPHYISEIIGILLPKLMTCRFIDMIAIRNNIKDLSMSLRSASRPPHQSHDTSNTNIFKTKLCKFFSDAELKVGHLTDLLENFDRLWADVSRFYGEDPSDISPEEYIRIWYSFFQVIETSCNSTTYPKNY